MKRLRCGICNKFLVVSDGYCYGVDRACAEKAIDAAVFKVQRHDDWATDADGVIDGWQIDEIIN